MSRRYPSGFIRPGYDPLEVPNAPTIGTATGGDTQASVAFTAPADVGGSAITAYYAVSNPDQVTATSASSPVTVTGLTNDTPYTFTVWALNSYGPSPYSVASGSVTPSAPRGVFAGGNTGSRSNVMDYVEIASTGNATDFGDLVAATSSGLAGCSSTTRGLFGGGATASASVGSNVIDYITIASTGNSTDFGDLTASRRYTSACSSSTRGVWCSGEFAGTASNVIDYVTIASAGNATDFGDATVNTIYQLAGCGSPTRGVFGGGTDVEAGTAVNIIQYITIASTGNASDFGDLVVAKGLLGACSSSTRAVFGGGSGTSPLSMSYITIATTGNSTNFGDLSYGGPTPNRQTATSSETRGLFAGGSGPTNVINYITIANTGNSTDFGDLTVARQELGSCSSAHGGLA